MYNRHIQIASLVVYIVLSISRSEAACDTHKQANCVVGERACQCFEFELVHHSVESFIESDGFESKETTYTYKVTNFCRKDLSFVVIGSAYMEPLSITSNDIIQSTTMADLNYTVEVGLMEGTPAFPGIKYIPTRDTGFNRGMWDLFTITVAGEVNDDSIVMLQGHAGATWETYGHAITHCKCLDCVRVCTPGQSGNNCEKCVGDGNGSRKKWWCMPRFPEPTSPTARKYDLLLVDTKNGDPIVGVAAGADAVDGKGKRLDCDCSTIEVTCPNHCFGNGECDLGSGTCSCLRGSGEDCDLNPTDVPDSTTSGSSSGSSSGVIQSSGESGSTTGEPERPCEDVGFCNSHGTCNTVLNECDCSEGWTGPGCTEPIPPQTCSDNPSCAQCLSDQNMSCHWCWPKGAAAPSCNETCADQDNVLVCDTTFIVWDPPKCPDECSGKGDCIDDVCQCYKGWEGINCAEEATLLSTEEKVAVGVGVGLLVFIGVIAGAFILLGGGGAAYKYYKLNQGKIENAQSNPMYQDTGKGVNPFYEDSA